MKNFKVTMALLLMAATLATASAGTALAMPNTGGSSGKLGDDDGVPHDKRDTPTPFSETNQKAELADGELYTLAGRLVYFRDQPYLSVDLGQHKWLASDKRKLNPYYAVIPREGLRDFEGRRIYLQARARGVIDTTRSQPEYVILLAPTTAPILQQPTR